MLKIGPLPLNGGSLEHLRLYGRNSPPPQMVGDIDPNFLHGAAMVQDHLVLKYKVWGCPLRGKTGDHFFGKIA